MPVAAADLRKIVGTTLLSDDELSLYCTQGQLVADELLVDATLSVGLLASIALFLAAHFYVLGHEGGGLTSEGGGAASESYKAWVGEGFLGTRFGQQACTLDLSGTLASLSSGKRGGFDFKSIRYTPGGDAV